MIGRVTLISEQPGWVYIGPRMLNVTDLEMHEFLLKAMIDRTVLIVSWTVDYHIITAKVYGK